MKLQNTSVCPDSDDTLDGELGGGNAGNNIQHPPPPPAPNLVDWTPHFQQAASQKQTRPRHDWQFVCGAPPHINSYFLTCVWSWRIAAQRNCLGLQTDSPPSAQSWGFLLSERQIFDREFTKARGSQEEQGAKCVISIQRGWRVDKGEDTGERRGVMEWKAGSLWVRWKQKTN